MKKFFLLTLGILTAASVSAELKYKDGSFHNLNDKNIALGEGNGFGVMNMTAESIVWPADEDGETTTSALLIVNFEMMSPEEIKQIIAQANNSTSIIKTEKLSDNRLMIFFVPAASGSTIRLNHEKLGIASLPAQQYKAHNVYTATVFNDGDLPVVITSEPAGATIIWDGKNVGKTPLTIEKVKVGNHTFSLTPANPKIANSIGPETNHISESNAALHFDMFKRKNIEVETRQPDAEIFVYYNGELVTNGKGHVVIENAPFDRKYDIEAKLGTDMVKGQLFVNDETPPTTNYNVIGSSSVSFTAKQNNKEVSGAELLLDGISIGATPFSKILDYGKYDVQASYGGYTGKKTFTVKKGTNEIVIKIPNKKNVGYSPFDVDYRKRAWGIAFNYINRYYNYKVNGKSQKHNWCGETGSSNGFQAGITWQPYFGYGQGLSTGIYYQMTFSDYDINDETGEVREGAIYFPLQYQFRLPLHRNFSIAVNAGAALTYGVSNQLKLNNNESIDLGYGENEKYGITFPDKLDYSLLFGAAIQFMALQLEAKYAAGLKDHKILYDPESTDKISCKSSSIILGLSLIF